MPHFLAPASNKVIAYNNHSEPHLFRVMTTSVSFAWLSFRFEAPVANEDSPINLTKLIRAIYTRKNKTHLT